MIAFRRRRMIDEEGLLWTVPCVVFIVFIKFDFEVDLHEIIITASYNYKMGREGIGIEGKLNDYLLFDYGLFYILCMNECMIGRFFIVMATVVNLRATSLSFSSIKTVTQVLPLEGQQIIVVGYSPDSLKRLQIVYEIHDTSSGECIQTGNISKFGVIFLTPYVTSDLPGYFLILVSSMGSRKVVKQAFGKTESKIVVRQVGLAGLEGQARSESFVVYYSPIYRRIYVLVQMVLSEQEGQLLLKGYEEEREVVSYRIVTLEQPTPQVVCSPTKIIFACGSQIALYQQRLQPRYFVLSNMEQFDILGFYSEFLLRLKEDGSLFTMSLGGTLRPLLEGPVIDYSLAHDRLFFLMGGGHIKVFKVKDAQLIQETQMETPNATKILSASATQIILGPL